MIINSNISPNTYIKQSEGNIVSNMDGEKVMLSITNGKYYNLGKMGSRIWDLVEVQITVKELVKHLIFEYDVEPFECQQQVISFLEHISEEGLIEIT
jgi:Xaa-Pro aminopeptidase